MPEIIYLTLNRLEGRGFEKSIGRRALTLIDQLVSVGKLPPGASRQLMATGFVRSG